MEHAMRDAAEERPVWAWIDLDALRHNARRALECAAGRAVIGVVKADAYGHGAADVARGLLAEGIRRLGVVSLGEGADLRRAGIGAPILLMGGLEDLESAERVVKWGLTPVLHDLRGFEIACRAGRRSTPLSVEVEVDTGMRRMGVDPRLAPELLQRIAEAPQLVLSGVYTHLARADEPDPEPSREQLRVLAKILRDHEESIGRPVAHVANSAGLLRRTEIETKQVGLETGAVRPGLMLYGVSPFADRSAEALDLRPVMSLAARVVAIRRVAAGESVGYGGEWRAARDTRVATLPVGYADGIPRSVLGRGEVYLGGARRPIVGRVSMDYIGVEIGNAEVELGSVATIFGQTPEGKRVPVESLAAAAGTIGYELLTRVGARVPRRVFAGPPPAEDAGPLDPAV
jgi:alanine racemase